MNDEEIKTAWISKGQRVSKTPWGRERSWSSSSTGHGKILFINKGCRTSLKYNPQKNESLFILKGELSVTFGNELSIKHPNTHPMKVEILDQGCCLHVQSGCPYRLEALEDSEVIEIGNFLNDVPVRIEDDYGRA
jgi:mannose-6-phosphate isomerase-like protein (cupin superfamily)